MIADLKPYAEYKKTEPSWLGEVPKHWDVRRMKYILKEQDSRSGDGKEQLLRVSQYTGVTQRVSAEGTDVPDTRADTLIGYKRVALNDLVINIMLAWNGSLGVSHYNGITSPAYCVYRFGQDAHPWYFHHLLRSPIYKGRIKAVSTGVVESRLRLYSDDLYRLESLLPPPDEQAAIVRFLDYAHQRVDRFIRLKKKMIALLNEQKQAIIHRAVTRGLPPNVPLKPSGTPWLGNIPEHWEVKRLKWVTRLQRGYDLPSDQRIRGSIPVISSGGIIDTHCEARAKGPGVVMGRYGSTDAVFYIEEDFWPHNTALFVTNFNGNFPKWCFYLLRTISKADYSSKSAVPGVDRKDLYEIYVPQPPFDEQVNLVEGINQQLQKFESVIFRTEREIALLREYRTRLISDVVTGKLDVREAAKSLPDEAAESGIIDEDEILAGDVEVEDGISGEDGE